MPFTADSPVAVLLKHVNQPLPVPPDSVVSRPIMEVIQTAVAKSPSMRWSSAGEFVSRLEAASGLTPAIAKLHESETNHHAVRTRLVWAGASSVALSAALGLAWWMWDGRSAPAVSAPPMVVAAAWEYWTIPAFLLPSPGTPAVSIVALGGGGGSSAQDDRGGRRLLLRAPSQSCPRDPIGVRIFPRPGGC